MSKLAMVSLALGAMTLVPALASADQCAWISKQHAEDALALIDVGSPIVFFCEPCGETRPAEVQVTRAQTARVNDGYWEVSVNGQGIDLAYTFVPNGDGKWVNLSKMVDCPSSGVSCMLDETLAVHPTTGGFCEGAGADDDDKFDDVSAPEPHGCSVGTRGGAGGTATLLLVLASVLALRRRRR
jgi:MYXO-CTERM domain-containing protein